jgi:uridine kinase
MPHDPDRAEVLRSLADEVAAAAGERPLRVAVDGITAAGKSTLARELQDILVQLGRTVIHLSMDDFHHPRSRRHARGRYSPDGYYEDAYDFAALASLVLEPLGRAGDRRYCRRLRDLASDAEVDDPPLIAPVDAIVLVDGTFLQRPSVAGLWDRRIFVHAGFDVALERAVRRDAALLGGVEEARRLYIERYHAACRRYLVEVRPQEQSTFVLVNDDLLHPSLLRFLSAGNGRRARPESKPGP